MSKISHEYTLFSNNVKFHWCLKVVKILFVRKGIGFNETVVSSKYVLVIKLRLSTSDLGITPALGVVVFCFLWVSFFF